MFQLLPVGDSWSVRRLTYKFQINQGTYMNKTTPRDRPLDDPKLEVIFWYTSLLNTSILPRSSTPFLDINTARD
jgi:hypothetical protein